MPTVTYDPADPEFPHGEYRGYRRGCKCRRCRKANSMNNKRRELEAMHGQARQCPASIVAGPLSDAIKATSLDAVAEQLGMDSARVARLARNKQKHVHNATAERILATLATTSATPWTYPAWRYRQRVRSLMALGYPRMWIAAQMGYGQGVNLPLPLAASYVTRNKWDRLDALYRRVADKRADPDRDGIPPRDVQRARRYAYAAGYFPPACYDDDGYLLEWAVRGDDETEAVRERRERKAAAQLEGLELSLPPHGESSFVIAAKLGVTDRTVTRWRTAAGLRLGWDEDAECAVVQPGGQDHAQRVLYIIAEWRAGHYAADAAVGHIRAVARTPAKPSPPAEKLDGDPADEKEVAA